ncbi:MAG: LysR family transcriptional regulator [Pseudomonadota bacterium]
MEFRQLRYFVAVAEEGNIGNAARRLNVSQPPVSRQIQALEYHLQAQLLIRTAKGVTLTDAGHTFLEDARKILAQADRAKERTMAADKGEIGRLDVAFFGSVIYQWVPNALKSFRQAVPDAEVSLTRMGKAAQLTAIRDGRIHVGVGRYYIETPGIKMEKLGEEAVFLVVSRDNRAELGESVTFSEVRHLPLVLFPHGGRPSFADLVVGAFRNANVEPRIAATAEDVTSALALTALGEVCCIVPESVAALRFPNLRFIRLEESSVRPPINIVYRDQKRAPVLQAFLSTLRRAPLSDSS